MYIFLLTYIEVDSTEVEVVWFVTEETKYTLLNADEIWCTTALIYVNDAWFVIMAIDAKLLCQT